jgi:hypothetical protein
MLLVHDSKRNARHREQRLRGVKVELHDDMES